MEKIDPVIVHNMAGAVIFFYIFAACCWVYIAGINIRFKSAYPAAVIGKALLWIYYAYKNYDFYFMSGNLMDYNHMWQNLGGVIVLAALDLMMCFSSHKILKQANKKDS